MAKLFYGDRIGKTARLSIGCSATIDDAARERILLTRRTDNGQWCLPGGRMDAGESLAETCIREVLDETGLIVRVIRLIGVYSTPHRIVRYADGNQWQIIAHNFEAQVISGELMLSDETTEFGYFTPAEIEQLELMEHHRERIADAVLNQVETIVR